MDAKDLFGYWKEVRSGLLAALDKLNDGQLDFTPRQGLWSLRETIVHIAGTEDGWLRHYTANRWHENPPQAAAYPTIDSLKVLLTEQHAITETQFAANVDATLAQTCSLPWGAQIGRAHV